MQPQVNSSPILVAFETPVEESLSKTSDRIFKTDRASHPFILSLNTVQVLTVTQLK